MEVIVTVDSNEISEVAANIIVEEMQKNQTIVLGLATGSSPVKTYEKLIEANQNKLIDFSKVSTFNLDEYVGLDPKHEQSYDYFMHDNLFNHINIDEANIHFPKGVGADIDKNIETYQKQLDEATIDLQILGLGSNGHIAFNEPGTSFESHVHQVELTEKTREDNKRFFNDLSEVPTHAITMGIADIMRAKQIIVLANGENKAPAIKELLEGYKTEDFPASILLDHPNVTLIIDEAAASLLED